MYMAVIKENQVYSLSYLLTRRKHITRYIITEKEAWATQVRALDFILFQWIPQTFSRSQAYFKFSYSTVNLYSTNNSKYVNI